MLGSVLPSEARILSLFLRENTQQFCGLQWADTLVEMFQCFTIYALNKKDKLIHLYIFEQWVTCAWSYSLQSIVALYDTCSNTGPPLIGLKISFFRSSFLFRGIMAVVT